MGFWPRTLWRAATGRPPRLVCARTIWKHGVATLADRADGRRESGAFLLGLATGATRRVVEFLYYDDVDPDCFAHGIVEFHGNRFGRVWNRCRERRLTVVADVHVHPGHFGQSSTDRHNPMIPEVGHLAIILPRFARERVTPNGIGVYEYLGERRWRDHSSNAKAAFHVGWWPS